MSANSSAGPDRGLNMLRWLDPILNPIACLPPFPEEKKPEQNAEALLARLESILRHRLKYALTGDNRSLLRGQGLDFADLREYRPGDDIRKIDWNVFARTLNPHVREYQEEKQLTLWLVLDCTASMHFGKTRTKFQLATELAGLFALLAEKSGHQLGAVLLKAKPEIIPPQAGLPAIRRILDRTLQVSDDHVTTGDPLAKGFQQLAHIIRKQATIIVFSDFFSPDFQWLPPLGRLSRQNRLICFDLYDAAEETPPKLGLLPVRDSETGAVSWFDTSNPKILSEYQEAFRQRRLRIQEQLDPIGAIIPAEASENAGDVLLRLLKAPERRRQVS